MTSSNTIAELVALIYRDIDGTQPWFGFVDRLATVLNAHDATVIVFCRERRQQLYHIMSDSQFAWTSQLVNTANQATYVMQVDASEPMTEDDWDITADIAQSQLLAEVMAKLGIEHTLMIDARNDEHQVVRIAAARTATQGPFTERERALLSQLAPHLKIASQLRENIQNTRHMLDYSLDMMARLNVGCIMLDTERRIVSLNQIAETFIANEPRFALKQRALQLTRDTESAQILERAMTAALHARKADQTEFTSTIEWHARNNAAWEIVVKSIPNTRAVDSNQRAVVSLLLIPANASTVDKNITVMLSEKHGLSKREADIAVLVAEGRTVEEAAALRGVTANTAKTQLRSAYAKLGISRRAQLIALLTHIRQKFR